MLLKDQIKTVALGLQPIVDEFVFVGGAIVECYVTRSAAEEARQTDDIDIVVELAHYEKFGVLQEKLIAGGFNPDSTSKVICRYRFKGIIVDIMPDNEAILGFSNRWYTDGIRHAQTFPIDDLTIKIFPAPIYLASKIEAYRQRGASDKRLSSDFEDIVYVLENRPEIVDEVIASRSDVRDYIVEFMTSLLHESDVNEGIRAVLGYSPLPGRLEYVINVITALSNLRDIK